MAGTVMVLHGTFRQPKMTVHIPFKGIFKVTIFGFLVFFTVFGAVRTFNDSHAKKMVCAFNSGQWEMVVRESEKAESVFYHIDGVTNPVAWYRGVAFFSIGRIEQAKLSFQQALKAHPRHVYSLNDLGVCYMEEGGNSSIVFLLSLFMTSSS